MPADPKVKLSRRVDPYTSRLLISWINKYGVRCEYRKEDGDTYTTFSASYQIMKRVESFIDGVKAHAETLTKKASFS